MYEVRSVCFDVFVSFFVEVLFDFLLYFIFYFIFHLFFILFFFRTRQNGLKTPATPWENSGGWCCRRFASLRPPSLSWASPCTPTSLRRGHHGYVSGGHIMLVLKYFKSNDSSLLYSNKEKWKDQIDTYFYIHDEERVLDKCYMVHRVWLRPTPRWPVFRAYVCPTNKLAATWCTHTAVPYLFVCCVIRRWSMRCCLLWCVMKEKSTNHPRTSWKNKPQKRKRHDATRLRQRTIKEQTKQRRNGKRMRG